VQAEGLPGDELQAGGPFGPGEGRGDDFVFGAKEGDQVKLGREVGVEEGGGFFQGGQQVAANIADQFDEMRAGGAGVGGKGVDDLEADPVKRSRVEWSGGRSKRP